jgi:hypothetical protein
MGVHDHTQACRSEREIYLGDREVASVVDHAAAADATPASLAELTLERDGCAGVRWAYRSSEREACRVTRAGTFRAGVAGEQRRARHGGGEGDEGGHANAHA